jgi:hypothetical protein
MTSETKLQKLMKVHARTSKEMFLKDGELFAPLWLIESKDGKMTVLSAPLIGTVDRDKHADTIRQAIKQLDGVRYVCAQEAWFLALPEGATDLNVRPSQSPDRREALMVMGEDINGEQRTGSYEIKRDADGKPRLEPFEEANEFSGRYADMFSVGQYT